MALTLRSTKGSALTWDEMDANWSGLADGSLWDNPILSGNLFVGGTLTVNGAAAFNGDVTIGDANTDSVAVNADVITNLTFKTQKGVYLENSAGSPSIGMYRDSSDRLIIGDTDFNNAVWIQNGANDILLKPGGYLTLSIAYAAGTIVNYARIGGATTGNQPYLYWTGSDAAVHGFYYSKGNAGHQFKTHGDSTPVLQFYVAPTANAANYLQVTGATAGNYVTTRVTGSDTDVGWSFSTKGGGTYFFQTNTHSETQFAIGRVASSVNYISVAGAATSGIPALDFTGSDTNIAGLIRTKGTGVLYLNNSSGTMAIFQGDGSAMANYWILQGSSTSGSCYLYPGGSDTNVNVALSSKGSGSVSLYTGGVSNQVLTGQAASTTQASVGIGQTSPYYTANKSVLHIGRGDAATYNTEARIHLQSGNAAGGARTWAIISSNGDYCLYLQDTGATSYGVKVFYNTGGATAGALAPLTDDTGDLGTTSLYFRDIHLKGYYRQGNTSGAGFKSAGSYSLGTISSGTVTPDPEDNPLQHYTNGGAHTLAPSSNLGSTIVDITNNASAGAITTSGFTAVSGDSFDTTNGSIFRCSITIANGGSLLAVTKMV